MTLKIPSRTYTQIPFWIILLESTIPACTGPLMPILPFMVLVGSSFRMKDRGES